MNNNLQPKDYAAIAFATAQLKQEIFASASFKKLMRYKELPGYTVDTLVKIAICPEDNPLLESACVTISLNGTDLPSVEPDDEDEDDVPY